MSPLGNPVRDRTRHHLKTLEFCGSKAQGPRRCNQSRLRYSCARGGGGARFLRRLLFFSRGCFKENHKEHHDDVGRSISTQTPGGNFEDRIHGPILPGDIMISAGRACFLDCSGPLRAGGYISYGHSTQVGNPRIAKWV